MNDYLAERVGLVAQWWPERIALRTGTDSISYRNLWQKALLRRGQIGRGVLVASPDPIGMWIDLIGAWAVEGAVVAVPRSASWTVARTRSALHQSAERGRGGVVIFTSGTTGAPRPIQHPWELLLQPFVAPEDTGPERWWFVGYDPGTFAGVHVVARALCRGASVRIQARPTFGALSASLRRCADIRVVSATPTFIRLHLIASGGDHNLGRLEEVVLGGEEVSQVTLEAVRQASPDARIIHTYASTEFGYCFSADDGLAGYPMHLLQNFERPRVPTVLGEELLIGMPRSEVASGGPPVHQDESRAWCATGDLVRLDPAAGRFHIVGRIGDRVHVAGQPVHVRLVEQEILAVPGVADAVVHARPSDLVGAVLTATVATEPGSEAESVWRAVSIRLSTAFGPHAVPRSVQFTPVRKEYGKTRR